MSSGPEHFKLAERLADQAHHFTYGDGANEAVGAALAAEAQVHATLALAAATAEAGGLVKAEQFTGLSPWGRVLEGDAS